MKKVALGYVLVLSCLILGQAHLPSDCVSIRLHPCFKQDQKRAQPYSIPIDLGHTSVGCSQRFPSRTGVELRKRS